MKTWTQVELKHIDGREGVWWIPTIYAKKGLRLIVVWTSENGRQEERGWTVTETYNTLSDEIVMAFAENRRYFNQVL